MVDPNDIQRKSRMLSRLLARKFGVGGADLRSRRKRVGRLLPGRIRRAVLEVEKAETMLGHPRIARQVDAGKLEHAYKIAFEHLVNVDPNDRIKGYVLGVLAVTAFNMLVIATAILIYARWQGWV